jgi:TrmH family RNA methyltransferase
MAIGRGRESSRAAATVFRGTAQADVITSRDNRWLKEFRVALRGGVATANGAVGVEGVRLAEEALTSGCRVEAVLFSESGERHRERLAPLIGRPEMGFPVLRTTDRLFEGVADTEHPQGVAALVVPRAWTLEDMMAATAGGDPSGAQPGMAVPLIVVLAGVQDPGNVGTILRTAAAFGATAAVTAATGQSGTASPYAPKALRASAGAALHMPIVSGMALGILLTQFKLRGIRTLASCVHEGETRNWKMENGTTQDSASQNALRDSEQEGRAPKTFQRRALAPWEVDWCEAVALLVGNEGAGLPEEVVHGADERIHIPMATLASSGEARVESLNAAAAAAVVLYEAFRQRKKKRV